MLKEETRSDFAFDEVLDRARALRKELRHHRTGKSDIEITVIDYSDDDGTVAKEEPCIFKVTAPTKAKATAVKEHLEGKDGSGHNCTCTQNGRRLSCSCP